MNLTTDRLVLRRFTHADVNRLVDLDSDPAVMRLISGGWPTPRRLIESEILPGFIRSYGMGNGLGVWAASERVSDEFVGWFSLTPLGSTPGTEVRLGFRLKRSAWGKGYATEGARARRSAQDSCSRTYRVCWPPPMRTTTRRATSWKNWA